VGTDASGNVHVVDTGNSRIQVLSNTGAFVTQWGSQGSGPGQFDFPNDVAIDASGNIYVVDLHNERIEKFAPRATPTARTTWGRLKTLFR
jgi:tripartite motif-containing protein 71